MTFTKEDIIARLSAGIESETIAQEMADMLNEAIDELEAKEAEAAALKEKTANYDILAEALSYYLSTYFPELNTVSIPTMEEFDEMIKTTINLGKELTDLVNDLGEDPDKFLTKLDSDLSNAINELNLALKGLDKPCVKKPTIKVKTSSQSPDEIIKQFINTL